MSQDQKFSTVGTGSVLPAGTLPMVDIGSPETLIVTIKDYSNQDGMNMVRVEYPDGFIKHHQADSVEQLLGVVSNQLKGRYGVTSFEYESIPDGLKPGQTINLKGVKHGT